MFEKELELYESVCREYEQKIQKTQGLLPALNVYSLACYPILHTDTFNTRKVFCILCHHGAVI